jgi:hypothetical protein
MGSGAEHGLGHADHGDSELVVHMGAQPGPAGRAEIGVAVDHQQPQPADAVQDRAQRRQFPPVELTWPVGAHLRHHRGAFGQHLREGGIGGHHGCRPGATAPEVMHVHGHAQAVDGMRMPAGSHAMRMPRPIDPGQRRPGPPAACRRAAVVMGDTNGGLAPGNRSPRCHRR